ncbi:MAG: phosphocholine cytidylyltransferase family protein [Clostridia bacterium]|nr:phosphocholine cytidylyltransferase family protein [Clostridia bacterium]
MKALILAAGLGSRLAPLTDKYPKAMVPVNGVPIIYKQIDNLIANKVFDITVVSGYKANYLKQRINEIYPDVHFIENFDYVSTNNMYSAYLARYAMRDSDFLMMNADVFYDKTVLTSLIACDAPNAIVTDIGLYNDESMKVIERNGRIVQISKTISAEDALGCSIDVYKFSRIGGQMFFDMCTDYIEKEHILNKWSEVALNDILEIIEFKACPLNGRWYEIDNFEDLQKAEVMFKE